MYRSYYREKYCIDLEVGDQILGGKFRNKKMTIEDFDINDKNEPVVNTDKGQKKILNFRIADKS